MTKAFLIISVKPTIASIDPYPNTKIGKDVTIHCRASGSPIPSLKWRRDGTTVDYVEGVQPNGKTQWIAQNTQNTWRITKYG